MLAALRFLNGLGPHRFTAIYQRDGATMRNRYFVDRDNPSLGQSNDIPFAATYCQYALSSREPFRTDDALKDERLSAHPSREAVRAYCGVPLLDAEGRALGTLCHFDYVALPGAEVDLELLLQLATVLWRHGAIGGGGQRS